MVLVSCFGWRTSDTAGSSLAWETGDTSTNPSHAQTHFIFSSISVGMTTGQSVACHTHDEAEERGKCATNS